MQVLLPGEDEPEPAPAPTPKAAPKTPTQPPCNYVVKAGDSLFEIGQVRPHSEHGSTPSKRAWHVLPPPRNCRLVPVARCCWRFATTCARPNARCAGPPAARARLQKYGLTVAAIIRLNPRLANNPDLIQPGTVVVLRRCPQPARKALF